VSCCLEHLYLQKTLVNNIRFFYPLIVFVSGFRDCWDYLKKYSLPYHPLHDQGFPSIGDVQTTLPVPREKWFEYAGERSGRFQVSVIYHSPIIRIAEILSGHMTIILYASKYPRSCPNQDLFGHDLYCCGMWLSRFFN
jgi:hypothetical protein